MPDILLFDTPQSRSLSYPLSLTRPIADLRIGILTIREWWELVARGPVFALTENYLQQPFPDLLSTICVDATVFPDDNCLAQILALQPGEMLEDDNGMIAYGTQHRPSYNQVPVWIDRSIQVARQERLQHITEVFKKNAAFIGKHFRLLAADGGFQMPDASNTTIGRDIFLEPGVEMLACTINTKEGPVYIGKNALVMEGTLIRGPVAIGEGAVVKMGTKLYPGTTIGPYCTAGGEIKNTMMMGFSNKAHDGYLGDSVVGEWCNFGAGSSNSNVKNTGGEVKMWDQASRSFIGVGQKGGLIMGDHSRCAINSSFNTGTTIGVSCNIFDGTYPGKHLPSFSWGNHESYEFLKACRDAANWKKMKGKEFTDQDRLILQHIFETTKTTDTLAL